jgi:hypothetical protein
MQTSRQSSQSSNELSEIPAEKVAALKKQLELANARARDRARTGATQVEHRGTGRAFEARWAWRPNTMTEQRTCDFCKFSVQTIHELGLCFACDMFQTFATVIQKETGLRDEEALDLARTYKIARSLH